MAKIILEIELDETGEGGIITKGEYHMKEVPYDDVRMMIISGVKDLLDWYYDEIGGGKELVFTDKGEEKVED